MRTLAVGRSVGIPNSFLLWIALATMAFLRFMMMGKSIVAIGNSERAAYLSGARRRRVIVGCFACAGVTSALGGLLLVGNSNQAYQAMGDQCLLRLSPLSWLAALASKAEKALRSQWHCQFSFSAF